MRPCVTDFCVLFRGVFWLSHVDLRSDDFLLVEASLTDCFDVCSITGVGTTISTNQATISCGVKSFNGNGEEGEVMKAAVYRKKPSWGMPESQKRGTWHRMWHVTSFYTARGDPREGICAGSNEAQGCKTYSRTNWCQLMSTVYFCFVDLIWSLHWHPMHRGNQ